MHDVELENAITAYAYRSGGEVSDRAIELIAWLVLSSGHLICSQCGRTLRQHVIGSLRRATPGHEFNN
jgi:hypothetical protein